MVRLGALIIVCGLAGCFPKAGSMPGPLDNAKIDAAHGRWPDTSAATLEHGRQLFVAHCNGCHHYPDRGAYSEDRWPGIVASMARKADLSAAEGQLVLQFVLADGNVPSPEARHQSETTP